MSHRNRGQQTTMVEQDNVKNSIEEERVVGRLHEKTNGQRL